MARKICPDCGYQGRPARRAPGSFALEVALWLCFIVPGLIYSLWRTFSRREVCPSCGSLSMIPIDSPRGRALAYEYADRDVVPEEAPRPARPPGRIARAFRSLLRDE